MLFRIGTKVNVKGELEKNGFDSEKIICGIYELINVSDNNKKYIGSSEDIINRIAQHYGSLKGNRHHCSNLNDAFNEYGEDCFYFKILKECSSLEESRVEEEDILSTYFSSTKTAKLLYNMTHKAYGGDTLSNHPDLEEIKERARVSNAKRIANRTDEQKKHASEKFMLEANPNWKGGITKQITCPKCGGVKLYSSNTCEKCRDRNGENNPFFGKKHSAESLEKMRISQLNAVKKIPINARRIIANYKLYDSITKAEVDCNLTNGAIINRIDKNSESIKNGLLIKFPGYYDCSILSEEEIENILETKPLQELLTPIFYEYKFYSSITEICDIFNVKYTTMANRIRTKPYNFNLLNCKTLEEFNDTITEINKLLEK
jgi:group I intron endonuclease